MIFIFQRTVLHLISLVAVFLFSFQSTQAGSDGPAPVLRLVTGGASSNGHVKIEWELSGGSLVEVQQAENKDFEGSKTIYRGADHATFVSGLENGTYYYRIRAVNGSWSEPVKLIVEHHSLRLAFMLFSLGALVFGLTVFIVVKGARHASTE